MTTPGDRELTHELRTELVGRMDHMEVGDGDLSAVIGRARRRQMVARVGGGIAALALFAGGVLAVTELADRPAPEPDVVTTPSEPTEVTTPGTAGPTPSTGPTIGPTATPDPTTSATPTPTSPPTPTEATEQGIVGQLLTTSGTIVAATDEGIVVIGADGDSHPVPGISGPVTQAHADGEGGIIFQRNLQGIGLLADGQVSTLVSLADFPPRTIDNLDPASDAATVEIEPSQLRLEDVDPATGRMAFQVDLQGGNPFYHLNRAEFTADLDGGAMDETDFGFGWENGVMRSLGGDLIVRNTSGEACFGLGISRDGRPVEPAWETSWCDGDPGLVSTSQLSRDGSALATISDNELAIREPVSGQVAARTDLPGGSWRVTDHVDGLVVVSDVEVWDHGRGFVGTSLVIDVETGEQRAVDGRATLVS